MSEEEEGRSQIIEEIDNPLRENEVGPTSIDVTDERVSLGPTSIDVTDEQASIVWTPPAEQLEEVQDQNKEIEQAQEVSNISKRKQKRRITSHLSNISKQIEKQGIQINKIVLMIQSLQKQKQTKPTSDSATDKSIKQIKSQVNQLQRQVTRIQDDVRRIRTASVTRMRQGTQTMIRKRSSPTIARPRSKKTKIYRSIQSGKQKLTTSNRLRKSKP
jgi:chromosome segregation ATPase